MSKYLGTRLFGDQRPDGSERTAVLGIDHSHKALFALRDSMARDAQLESLCDKYALPWDFAAGYEPRWYNGPAPSEVQVLLVMAEPGPITETEAQSLGVAINHEDWIGEYDLSNLEHYWRAHLLTFCTHIWPQSTQDHMCRHLGGTCSFWMSLPPGSATESVPAELVNYFSATYLKKLLALFPNATIVASGGKARDRLKKLNIDFDYCWAFTRPGCNQKKAKESWRVAGEKIRKRLGPMA